jgi:hypothetical protein
MGYFFMHVVSMLIMVFRLVPKSLFTIYLVSAIFKGKLLADYTAEFIHRQRNNPSSLSTIDQIAMRTMVAFTAIRASPRVLKLSLLRRQAIVEAHLREIGELSGDPLIETQESSSCVSTSAIHEATLIEPPDFSSSSSTFLVHDYRQDSSISLTTAFGGATQLKTGFEKKQKKHVCFVLPEIEDRSTPSSNHAIIELNQSDVESCNFAAQQNVPTI